MLNIEQYFIAGRGTHSPWEEEEAACSPERLDTCISSAPSADPRGLPVDRAARVDRRDYGHVQLRVDRHRAGNDGNIRVHVSWSWQSLVQSKVKEKFRFPTGKDK